ncbi:MAG: recombinase RecA [Candidatus Omnitrophota bacterium]|nr:recombinase RecA [Candidatus Omnitrophota bacterium]
MNSDKKILASEISNRQKALELALAQIEKQFGKGSIMKLGGDTKVKVDTISTGALTLDIALGVGGLPRGRVIEIFGPEASGKTTITLTAIREVQKKGGVAAFIDAEHAFDSTYAKIIGVNLDNLLISQPDTGEQALEIAETLVRSNAVDLVVIDSVAALTPRAEIEGEMGDSHIGLQARLMSQALRKLTAAISKSRTCVIFINQLREKIGVMFGCFHYDSRVVLADGNTMKIGKIVNQRLPLKVVSYNLMNKSFESKKIVGWYDNGRTDKFLQFVVRNNTKDGRATFGCTANHMIFTENGWRKAGDLKAGECVMVGIDKYFSKEQVDVVAGSVLGDGSLRRVKTYNTRLRIGHGYKQNEYAEWKQSLFKGILGCEYKNSKGGHSFETIPCYELTQIYEQTYSVKGKDPSQEFIAKLGPLATAIWYMDDGTFDRERKNRCSIACADIPVEKRDFLVKKFKELGVNASRSNGRINFGVEATKKLHSFIAPYVHPSMDYKLMPEFKGRFVRANIKTELNKQLVPMPIFKIYEKPLSKKTHRFDLKIEGNHTYLVDGVIVHNSPETTPGGRALKFYSSVRLDVRKIATLKETDRVIGNRVRVRVVKNKVAPPFCEAEFEILHNEGIAKTGSVLDAAVKAEVVQKSGTWLSFKEEKLGQGRDAAIRGLREKPKLQDEIEKEVRKKSGLD